MIFSTFVGYRLKGKIKILELKMLKSRENLETFKSLCYKGNPERKREGPTALCS